MDYFNLILQLQYMPHIIPLSTCTMLKSAGRGRLKTGHRLFSVTRTCLTSSSKESNLPHDTLSQGRTSRGSTESKTRSTQAETARSGYESRAKSDNPMDAASQTRNPKPKPSSIPESGNKEDIGFAEQVGSQSSSTDASSGRDGGSVRQIHRDEEAATPGVLSSLKRMMGFGTDSGDVKQNRGGGRGVTGTGTFSSSSGQQRKLHTQSPSDREFHYTPHASEKDKPTAIDYISDVAASIAKSQAGTGKSHNLEHRSQRKKVTSPDAYGVVVSTKETIIASPRQRSNTPHSTGEWRTSGVGDDEYRTVGTQDPYEPPSDDVDHDTKEDALKKKLRYGGLSRKPEIV